MRKTRNPNLSDPGLGLYSQTYWDPPQRVYIEHVFGRVSVDEQFRVLIGRDWVVAEAHLEDYWHLFRNLIGEDWPKVVEANDLSKKKRQTLRSTGLRNGQSRLIGQTISF